MAPGRPGVPVVPGARVSAADTPEPPPRVGTGDDATGYTVAPVRYSAHGRETIDRIRDELGDDGFVAYCRGAAMKYEDRAGLKGDAEEDRKKARWYRAMVGHVLDGTPDPRAYRAGHEPYRRRLP